jgi:hypothetical protein
MESDRKDHSNNEGDGHQRPERGRGIVTRRFPVVVSDRLRQNVHQSVASEAEIGQGHPDQKTADCQPNAISFRAEVMNGERHGSNAHEHGQSFCDIRRGGGQTRAAVAFSARIGTRPRKQRLERLRAQIRSKRVEFDLALQRARLIWTALLMRRRPPPTKCEAKRQYSFPLAHPFRMAKGLSAGRRSKPRQPLTEKCQIEFKSTPR